ncbi:tyrosine-type recombinase/integrase [Escherichia coli]|nr:tyrosine-type recombinase/integrase [Escherichia coli]
MSKRRYLTGKEVQAMMQAVCYGATGARDYCLILLAYRHGMRISELLDLHYQDLDLNEGRINIRHTVRYTASNAARFAGLWERNNLINEKLKREEV